MVLLNTPTGNLGSTAYNFTLPGIDGRDHSLSEYAQAPVLVILFICNHCPYVQAVENRLITLANDMRGYGVKFVAINSNDTDQYPEDSFVNMALRAKQKHYPFDYLYDASQEVAKKYEAVCTPDFFVYDTQRLLRYRGRLDDSPRNPSAVRRQEMKEAILAILHSQPVPEPQHPAMGCSIKWKET